MITKTEHGSTQDVQELGHSLGRWGRGEKSPTERTISCTSSVEPCSVLVIIRIYLYIIFIFK